MKIVFFGSSHRAVQVLEALCANRFAPDILVTTNSPEVDHWATTSVVKPRLIVRPKKLDQDFFEFFDQEIHLVG